MKILIEKGHQKGHTIYKTFKINYQNRLITHGVLVLREFYELTKLNHVALLFLNSPAQLKNIQSYAKTCPTPTYLMCMKYGARVGKLVSLRSCSSLSSRKILQ